MKRTLATVSAAFITTGAMLLPGTGAYATPGDATEAALPPGTTVTLNDGSVLGPNDSVSFTFIGDKPETDGGIHVKSCPEVNDPPKYDVKGTPRFLPDENKPQSTWLLPGQQVSWAVSGSHTFTWDIGAAAEFEASAILTKAKVKVDTKISNSWTWNNTQTVKDKNESTKRYRAVLSQVGWRLTTVKSWIAPPCNPKTKTIIIDAPKRGDMSIGRQST